jgi:hypothetical protein
MRKFIGAVALAAVALSVVAASAMAYSNGFESDTAGWNDFSGTITQQPSGYDGGVSTLPYADDVPSASGNYHARLDRGTCTTEVGGGGDTVRCPGPYTQWGGYGDTWNGTYTTQVDIYLDAAYADNSANEDSYGGNACLLTTSGDAACNGTRFDYTSAINNNSGNHLRDFGFVVGTGQAGNACTGWTVNAQQNVNRINAFPDDASKDPACITGTGWYTFKHTFFENGDENLEVLMQIIDVDTSAVVADWSIVSGPAGSPDHISTVGCNRYGWFSNQEIFGLPIDNAKMEGGCAAPTITDGQVLPTGTTCQGYHAGATPLEKVQYTLKSGKINSVAPGVFFYYGTITGTEDQAFTITQSDSSSIAPFVPVQHGQVMLYDANCNLVKGWSPDSDSNGVVTGTLPSTGTFIISVKYSASDLKGTSDPDAVTYTIDGTSVVLDEKPKA